MSKNVIVKRRAAALMSVAALATTGLIATAGPASAVVTAGAGEADAQGRPASMQDGEGVALALCIDAINCEPADPADPLHGGYFAATAQVGPLLAIYGIETAAGEDAAGNPTDQAIIANVARFRADGLQPGARYTVKDPWGTNVVFADDRGRVDTVLESGGEVGTVEAGHVTTFLRRLTAPAGFLGDLETAGPVTGSPTGFNRVTVTGPGVNATQRNFTVNGQMLADTAMTSVATKSLNLGNIRKSTPTVRNIRVSSFGTAAAAVTVAKRGANPGQFAVVNNCATAASGAACNIQVTYTPRANRNATAILAIGDNGLAAPRQVTLTGVAQDTRVPQLQSRTPGKGATVRPGKSVKVQFSEAVRGLNRSTFTLVDRSNNRKVAATLAKRGNSYVLNPRRALKRGTSYLVRLDGGARQIRDLANNGARDMQWKFRTR